MLMYNQLLSATQMLIYAGEPYFRSYLLGPEPVRITTYYL